MIAATFDLLLDDLEKKSHLSKFGGTMNGATQQQRLATAQEAREALRRFHEEAVKGKEWRQ